MTDPEELAHRIQSTGFACTSCAACCKSGCDDCGTVIVSPPEVRAVMAQTGLSWDEVAVPYPETIDDGHGGRYTLGWCLRHRDGECRFLKNGRCSIYASRPWICRTYPFMLDRDDLVVSACDGIGRPIDAAGALQIAKDLVARQRAEEDEEMRVGRILRGAALPAGGVVVIDSEGVKPVHG